MSEEVRNVETVEEAKVEETETKSTEIVKTEPEKTEEPKKSFKEKIGTGMKIAVGVVGGALVFLAGKKAGEAKAHREYENNVVDAEPTSDDDETIE